MTTILVTCRACGRTFTPDRQAILSGEWRICPDCQAPSPVPSNCIGPDCAVVIGLQIHRCSGCEWPIRQQPTSPTPLATSDTTPPISPPIIERARHA